MKKLCFLLGLVALLAFAKAQAQVPTYAYQNLSFFTNWVTASAANLFTNVSIDCRKQASVTLRLTTANNVTSANGFKLYYSRSLGDGSWETALSVVGLVPPTGASTPVLLTNLNTYGAGFIRLEYLTNADGTANITNYTAAYGVKISSP
jgi:hypothetical protein